MYLLDQPTTLSWMLLLFGACLFMVSYGSGIERRMHGNFTTSPAVVTGLVISTPMLLLGWTPLVYLFVNFVLKS